MALIATPVFPQSLGLGLQNFKPADTSTLKLIVTGATNGTKVVSLTATSTETANARVAQIWVTRAGVNYLISSVNIPVNAGFDGTTAVVDLFNITQTVGLPAAAGTTAFDGQTYLTLQASDLLQVSLTTTLAANKEIDVTAVFWNY